MRTTFIGTNLLENYCFAKFIEFREDFLWKCIESSSKSAIEAIVKMNLKALKPSLYLKLDLILHEWILMKI